MSYCNRYIPGHVEKIWYIGPSVTTIDGRSADYRDIGPGDTLIIEAGTRGPLSIQNIQGSPYKPITILNGDGAVTFSSATPGVWYGLWLRNSQFIHISGNGKAGTTYGFVFDECGQFGVIAQCKVSDIEIDYCKFLMTDPDYVANNLGISIQTKSNDDYDYNGDGVDEPGPLRGEFVQRNTFVHDCLFDGVDGEYNVDLALYIGNSDWLEGMDVGGGVFVNQPELEYCRVHHNTFQFVNQKATQIGSCVVGCEVDHNSYDHCPAAATLNPNCININPGCFNAKVHHNTILEPNGNGIYLYAEGGVCWNNLITYPGQAATSFMHGIVWTYKATYFHSETSRCYRNTIIEPLGYGILWGRNDCGTQYCQANLIEGYGAGYSFISYGSSCTATYNFLAVTAADCWFVNAAGGDFHLQQYSPAIDGGLDISTWVVDDLEGIASPKFTTFDCGCYESESAFVEYVWDYLFQLDFEGNDLSEFSSTSGADISTSAGAALVGNYGLSLLMDDATADYGVKYFSTSTRGKCRFRFYFDPNSMTMTDNTSEVRLAYIYNQAGQAVCTVDWWKVAGGYQVWGWLYDDSGTARETGKTTISDEPHYIEVYLQRATNSSSSDGSMEIWIDGSSVASVTGKDNFDRFVNMSYSRWGAGSIVATGLSGTFYLDHIELNDSGVEIGLNSVVNGHVRTTNGWTATNSVLTADNGGYLGQCIKIANNSAAVGCASQQIMIPAGTYHIEFYQKNGTASGFVCIASTSYTWTGEYTSSPNNGAWTKTSSTFVIAYDNPYINLFANSVVDGQYTYFDEIRIYP